MDTKNFSVSALCETGLVKKTNQDNILVKIGEENGNEFGLFIVADGMGGLSHGDSASSIIIDEFSKWWNDSLPQILMQESNNMSVNISNSLDSMILKTNSMIIDLGNFLNTKIGSTLSLLFLYQDSYIIKHVGDSRIYIVNKTVDLLTEDHSWVHDQVKEARLTPQEAKSHPKRNVLTNCIGIYENVEWFEKINRFSSNDSFILCSDGFHNYIEEKEILESISNYFDNSDISIDDIIKNFYETVKKRGAGDNVSIIIACNNKKKNFHKLLIKRFAKIFGGKNNNEF